LVNSPILARLDLVVKNRTGQQPGSVQLWEWQGDYTRTVAAKPLFADVLDLSGPDLPQVRHFFPWLRVQRGRTYYVEIHRAGVDPALMCATDNPYPVGMMFVNGKPQPEKDARFATFTGSRLVKALASSPKPLPELPATTLVPPLPPGRSITRDDYLQMVRKYVDANRDGWMRDQGKHGREQSFYLAFLYRATGEEPWAQAAAERLKAAVAWLEAHADENVGFDWLPPACMAYQWIAGSKELSKEDHELIRRGLLAAAARHWKSRERGAMNRSMGSALGYSLMAKLFPDHAEADAWRKYAERVWNDWAEQADTEENSLHYHAVWWEFVVTYAQENGLEEVYQRPEVRRLIERYRDQLSPLGTMPPYGDCYGWGFEWGGWVLLFEKAAAMYHDGTYRWAAHRVFNYLLRYAKDTPPHLMTYEDMPRLALAWLAARDDVLPQAPPSQCKLLTRKRPVLLDESQRIQGQGEVKWYRLAAEEVPDKLVLRGPGDWLYATFDLMPQLGHGHGDGLALVALTAADAALVTDTSYFDRGPEHHDLLYVKRLRGGRIVGKPPERVDIKSFVDQPGLCWCKAEMDDYGGWGVRLTREVFFAKDRFLWVGDEARFSQAMEAIVGPLWHVAEVAARGSNWFDVRWNEPRGFRWNWRNGDRRLLVYFVAQPKAVVDFQYQAWKVEREPHEWSPPLCLYQKQTLAPARRSIPVRFDTLLVPHPPTADPAALAAGIRSGSQPGSRWVEVQIGSRTFRARVDAGRPTLETE